jgi:hypothetical protein
MAARRVRNARSYIGGLVLLGGDAFAADGEPAGLKWIQCCKAGTYLGHPKFAKIEWNAEVFQKIVDNLHKHPGYKAGADGIGCARVIPWDYEHENEIRAQSGGIPRDGLPAASWTYDLRVTKSPEGEAQLWALTEWLPQAREQIETGVYQGCSVCVLPSYIDPVSGVDQGPTMTSIALTNSPFIQGMEPLAATLEQFGPAESPLEVLVGIRSALELPEDATVPDVIAQLHALLDAIANDTIPEYVEEGYLLDRIRRLLKLPLLATPEQILGGAEAMLNQMSTSSVDPTVAPKEDSMAAIAAFTALACILGCKDDEQSIMQAAQKAKTDAAQVEQASEITDGLGKLKALFGAADMDATLAAATKAIADAEALKPTVAALTEALKALKSGATADAEAETQAVAASMAAAAGSPTLKDRLYPAILQARVGCIDEKTGRVDADKLAKFRADYPLPEEHRSLLTRAVVSGANGVQLGGAITGYGTQPITQSASDNGQVNPELQKVIQAFNDAPGPNPVAKANALLCSRVASHKALPFAEQCRVAGQFASTLASGQIPAGFTL